MLEGFRVVEGSAFVAAPMCGMTLAQLGADVIRFDQIGGGIDYHRWPVTKDNHSIYWADLNKGKRSFAVDLRSDEGRELVTRLICAGEDEGGIFSTNLPARGWLSYESLSAHRKDLIQLAITGDRHGGTAVDYTVNAKVGYPAMTGPPDDDRPVNHVMPAWDNVTAYLAAISILAAERHRRLTGEGQQVTLALADVALATMGHLGFLGDLMINDEVRPRYGNYLYGAWGRDFPTSDGERVMIIAVSHKQWRGLLTATGLDDELQTLSNKLGVDFNKEGDRFNAREEIAGPVGDWVGGHTLDEVKEAFDANGVCWGKYQTVRQMVGTDRDCSEDNPIFKMVEQPDIGSYLVPHQPMRFSSMPDPVPNPAPRLGEHTDEILTEVLGMSSGEIGRLHDSGVVAGQRG
jgi:2-methylfumaryl-CoA isomerase